MSYSALTLFALIAVAAAAGHGHGKITSEGCGKTKHCYQFPENCEPNTPNCRFVSWKPNKEDKSKFDFEMSGDTGAGMRYISIAFALISDMKDGDMYYCDGEDFGVGTFLERRERPAFLPIGKGVTNIKAETIDGIAQCTFTRDASINREVSEGADHDFDLENHKYYLLVAVGDMKDKQMKYHDWRVHLRESYDFSMMPGDKTKDELKKAKYWFATALAKVLAMLTKDN